MTKKAGVSFRQASDEERRRMNAWWDEYRFALGELTVTPGSTLDQFVDVAWRLGLLAHVSPPDPELRALRKECGQTLWYERDNPILYWRLPYAMQYLRTSKSRQKGKGSHVEALYQLFGAVGDMSPRLKELFPELERKPLWSWQGALCERLVEKARIALEELDVTPHDPLLSKGATGVFRDIPCRVDEICADGTLWLSVIGRRARDREWRALLGYLNGPKQLNDGLGLCPSLIDATQFMPPGSRRR